MEQLQAGYESNYDLFSLFISKEVKFWPANRKYEIVTVRVPSIREFYIREDVNAVYNLWNSSVADINKFLGTKDLTSFYDFLTLLFYELWQYKEYSSLAKKFKSALEFFFPHIKIKNDSITLDNGVNMTEEICDYALYIVKLSCGEKVTPPMVFTSEAAKKFYLAQKAAEERIARLKANNDKNKDALLKALLSIEYSFPNYTHEYLLDQTMAQIRWLQSYAAGAVSYELNAQAYAAGNMKKGKKLDFFIK